jgi:hypothetical protein
MDKKRDEKREVAFRRLASYELAPSTPRGHPYAEGTQGLKLYYSDLELFGLYRPAKYKP